MSVASPLVHGLIRSPVMRCIVRLVVLAALLACTHTARASIDTAVEYRLKAAYLYNFTKFVEWPAARTKETPFVIGVIDPGGTAAATIAETLRGKSTPDGRSIEIRTFPGITADLAACHQLFITRNARVTIAGIRTVVGNAAVLIIGETEGFAENGGIINLLSSGEAVRCEVNLAGAGRAGVKLSGRLASVSRLVRETSRP